MKRVKFDEIIKTCFECPLNEECRLAQKIDARHEIHADCPLEEYNE